MHESMKDFFPQILAQIRKIRLFIDTRERMRTWKKLTDKHVQLTFQINSPLEDEAVSDSQPSEPDSQSCVN